MICVAFKNFRFICIFKYFILFWDSVSSDIAQAQVWPQTPNPPLPSTFCIFEMTGKHHCDWLALLLLRWVVYLSTLMPREHPSLNSCPRAGVLPFWWSWPSALSSFYPSSQCVVYVYYIVRTASEDRERRKDYLKNWKPAGRAKGILLGW